MRHELYSPMRLGSACHWRLSHLVRCYTYLAVCTPQLRTNNGGFIGLRCRLCLKETSAHAYLRYAGRAPGYMGSWRASHAILKDIYPLFTRNTPAGDCNAILAARYVVYLRVMTPFTTGGVERIAHCLF